MVIRVINSCVLFTCFSSLDIFFLETTFLTSLTLFFTTVEKVDLNTLPNRANVIISKNFIMINISRESEINLINILIDQDIISGKDLANIKKVSTEKQSSQLDAVFELKLTDEEKILDLLVKEQSLSVVDLSTMEVTDEIKSVLPSNYVNINFIAPMLIYRNSINYMKLRKFGRIINIASTAGRVGEAGYSGYCASKAGLIALSKVTAIEGAPHNISCISISPTWVETPMMDNAIVRHSKNRKISKSSAKKALKSSNPQGRLVQPEEIASLIAFACGETCPGLSNEDIQINAGAIW